MYCTAFTVTVSSCPCFPDVWLFFSASRWQNVNYKYLKADWLCWARPVCKVPSMYTSLAVLQLSLLELFPLAFSLLHPYLPFQNSSDLFHSLSFKGSLFCDFLSPFGTIFISLCNFCCSTRSPAACYFLITSIVSHSIFNIVHVRRSLKVLRFRYKELLEIFFF